jgi:hypothetical protein
MADSQNDRAEVDWRAAMSQLRAGNAVDVPCATEEEFQRRAAQITKRGEKQGIPLELTRGDGFLRIAPRIASEEADDASGRRADREARRRERAGRRGAGEGEVE